ncbi:MAG: hypothetical protein M3Q87_04075 [Actinomycetota bacterium]|nr:hypothetical protein [Actinomycetota bacterium]
MTGFSCRGTYRFRLAPHLVPTAGTGGSWWRTVRDLAAEFFDGAEVVERDVDGDPVVWVDDCGSMRLVSQDEFDRTGSTVTVELAWAPGDGPSGWSMPKSGWVLEMVRVQARERAA